MARLLNQKTSHFVILSVFLTVSLAAVGCGRKGAPKPPEDFAPKPVLNLNVEGSVSGVKLSWETPPVDPDKDEEDLKALAGFEISRCLYSKEGDDDFEPIGRLNVPPPPVATATTASTGETAVVTQPPAPTPTVSPITPTSKFTFTDEHVEPGKIYNYQVRPFNVDQVNGEPGQTLRVTYLGENSRVERIVLVSERVKPIKPGSQPTQ